MIELFGILCLLAILLGIGAAAGLLMAEVLFKHRRKALDNREAEIQADWSALLTSQRLNAAFMDARKTMWEEAIRQPRDPNNRPFTQQ